MKDWRRKSGNLRCKIIIDANKLLNKREQILKNAAVNFIDITIGRTVIYLVEQKQTVNLLAITDLLKKASEDNRPAGYKIPASEAEAALNFIENHSL